MTSSQELTPIARPRSRLTKGTPRPANKEIARLSMIAIQPPTPPPTDPGRSDSLGLTSSPRQSILNRMSLSLHNGTPPPAVRLLHPEDARDRPLSAVFSRKGNHTPSISGSRPQSILIDPTGEQQPFTDSPTQLPLEELGVEEEETAHEQASEETTTPTATRRKHSSQGWNDPLSVIERRRRRDFTIGSHHPLQPPPTTPAMLSREASPHPELDEEVEQTDILGEIKELARRFNDMPWITDPCVATLVIPRKAAHEETSCWYKSREKVDIESSSETLSLPVQAQWVPQPPAPAYSRYWGRDRRF